jgi:hypothetical protein
MMTGIAESVVTRTAENTVTVTAETEVSMTVENAVTATAEALTIIVKWITNRGCKNLGSQEAA